MGVERDKEGVWKDVRGYVWHISAGAIVSSLLRHLSMPGTKGENAHPSSEKQKRVNDASERFEAARLYHNNAG